MNNQINKVTNANIYMNGVSYMGRAEEVTLPEIQPKMTDHKALGMIGELELPAGLQKMSMKIKWNAIYSDVMRVTHDVFTAIQLMIFASIDVYQGGSRMQQIPCTIFVTVTPKKSGGLTFKPSDNVEREDEFNVTAYRLEIDNEEIVNIDIMANIWSVNGVDQLGRFRKNLGV